MTCTARAMVIILSATLLSVFHSPRAFAVSEGPYIVIDVANGDIISANRETDRWYPASLTKLMTAYVTMKAIQNNELEAGSPVRISKNANRMPASRMGYKIGTKLRVDTALKILIVKSANDVAVALAETVAGSVAGFSKRMNTVAAGLGMSESNFANPNGLHDANQFASARDLAILSRRLLLDFPQYSDWFAIPAIKTSIKTHYSYNLLLERFAGANGMKTGFVCASGYNMVASAKRNERQLIAVVLGAGSQTHRAVTAARLLSKAFADPDKLAGNLLSNADRPGALPKNMRPVLCTQQARKLRYEPGAGKAVINSPYLSARKIFQKPLLVTPGNIDGAPGNYSKYRLPGIVPTKRPSHSPSLPFDGQLLSGSKLQGAIPLPIWRPEKLL